MLTLFGSLLGGVFRLLPEWFKMVDKKDERSHELAMFDKQLAADAAKAVSAQKLEETRGANTLDIAGVQAMIEAIKAQGQLTGVKLVDGINSLMRPILTFWWCIVLYSIALGAEYYSLVFISKVSSVDAILQLWGADEKAIVASIISFWFVDRAIRHMRGK